MIWNGSGRTHLSHGFGTLAELLELGTFMQTKKLQPYPIILIGGSYLAGLLKWLTEEVVAPGHLDPSGLHQYTAMYHVVFNGSIMTVSRRRREPSRIDCLAERSRLECRIKWGQRPNVSDHLQHFLIRQATTPAMHWAVGHPVRDRCEQLEIRLRAGAK